MRVTRFIFCIFLISLVTPSQAQFGKLKDKLKEKADQLLEADPNDFLDKQPEEIVKDQLKKKTEAERAAFDTSTFIYTIAFLDKTESFENQQKNEKIIKAADFLLTDNEQSSPESEATSFYELGRFNYLKRSYWIAEINLIAAKEAFELLTLQSDPIYLKSLGTLALLYNDMGRYDQAEEFASLASDGWRQSFGAGSKGYIANQHNLAIILMNQGKYGTAEKQLIDLSQKIKEKEGAESMPLAIATNNQAILNLKLGRAQQASEFIDRATQLADASLKEKSGTFIQLLTNQALIYQQNQDYEQAEKIYLRAKALQESRLKLNRTSDPDYAHLLSNMAALYMYQGQLDQAENYLNESLEIMINKYGERFPAVAAIQYELGTLYRLKSDWSRALATYQNAYETRKELLGELHPGTIHSLYGLAVAKWYRGDKVNAKTDLELVLNQSLSFINEFFASMSEVEKTSYWDQIRPYFQAYFNFAAESTAPATFIDPLFNYRTATKGILLSSTSKLKTAILSSGDPSLIGLYEDWVDQKKSLAIYYAMSQEELRQQKINLDSLENRANTSERQLSELSGVFKGSLSDQQGASITQVQQELAEGEALVEIIQYPVLDKVLTESTAYMALIVKYGTPPMLIKLDGSVDLDRKPFSAYKNLIRLKVKDTRSYANFWQLIDNQLTDTEQVFVSADGIYHQINLATLLTPDGGYVLDQYQLHLIGNPKQLLEQEDIETDIVDAFLLGYPSYGSDDIAALPGTDAEVTAIANLMKSVGVSYLIKKQREASETAIKKSDNPSIFHVATHGFFLEDVGQGAGSVFGVKIDQASKNPLLRSGLLLAGVSGQQDKSFSGFEEDDNGVLNAYEAVNIDLSNTRLVVLSACETGQGDIKSGEGVYGLQRAFKLAGADRLMMSLWKVDDNATKELMIKYYQNWLGQKEKPAEAFRKAQLAVREKYPEPYFWGAFVMVE